jgi:hypothetical protein
MKSYSVKSNAKRFARGIAAKHPASLEAIEPVETSIGGMGWFPAVEITAIVCTEAAQQRIAMECPDAVVFWKGSRVAPGITRGDRPEPLVFDDATIASRPELAKLHPLQQAMVDAILDGDKPDQPTPNSVGKSAGVLIEHKSELIAQSDIAGNRVEYPIKNWPPESQRIGRGLRPVPPEIDVRDFGARGSIMSGQQSGKTAMQEAFVEKMLDEGHSVAVVSRGGVELRGAGSAKDITPAVNVSEVNLAMKGDAELAALAASLPPRTESSREEIDRRRAERRVRIDAEKVNPTPKPEKINKTKIILDLIKRKGGATQEELETATGWQRHTLRGFIAGTLRKRLAPVGLEIECIRKKGEPTRYMVPMMEADRKGGEA